MDERSRHDRLKQLLLEVRDLTGEARDAALAAAGHDDPALAEEARALLAVDADLPVLRTGALVPDGRDVSPDALIGETIGPYEIAGVLGEGGMGVVYRATQHEPLRREVALKVVRRGMDTARIIARFTLERQALAVMEHPAIARVFDAGVTADGRPYFAMELVTGEPITDHAERCQLDLDARLGLFLQVCAGVRHAHQKGVIHRDLKPGNVLVTTIDGVPTPKIIDFGIAKALDDSGAGLTGDARGIGTPAYMSPEQAGASEAPVDTRTDVYALGVLLYELLVGAPPFAMTTGTPAEARRVLRDATATRPSAAPTGPGGVKRALLTGDLDSVVLKALEFDVGRRYGSVEALADDIVRFTEGLPVTARAATWSYRAARFVGRHRLAVGVAAVVALSVTASLAVTVASLVEARRERDAAREARDAADATTAFLVEMIASADPFAQRRGGTSTDVRVSDVLEGAVARLDSGAVSQPAVEIRLRRAIGGTLRALGLVGASCAQYEAAGRRASERFGALDDRAVSSLTDWANCLAQDRRLEEAEVALAPVLRSCDEAAPAPAICSRAFAAQGNLAFERGDFAASEAGFRRALETIQAAPDSPPRLANETGLARALAEQRRYDEAETIYRSVIARYEQAFGPDYGNTQPVKNGLGILLQYMGRPREAMEIHQQTVDTMTRLVGADHDLTLRSRFQVADAACEAGEFETCHTVAAGVVEARRQALGESDPVTLRVMATQASGLWGAGDREASLQLLGSVVALGRQHLPDDDPGLPGWMTTYAERLAEAGRAAEAIDAASDAIRRSGALADGSAIAVRAERVIEMAGDAASDKP